MPLNINAMQNKAMRAGGKGWSPVAGKNRVVILPPHSRYFSGEEINDFALEFRTHYFAAEGMDVEVVRCRRDIGEYCIACDAYQRNKDAKDPGIAKRVAQMKSGERHLMNMIDLNRVELGIQQYDCGRKVYYDLLKYIGDPNWNVVLAVDGSKHIQECINPNHALEFTLNLVPQGQSKSGYNEYDVAPSVGPGGNPIRLNFVPVLQQDPKWMEKLNSLESYVAEVVSNEQMRTILLAVGIPLDGIAGGPAVAVTASTAAAPIATIAPAAPVPVPIAVAPAPPPAATPIAVAPAAPVPVSPYPSPASAAPAPAAAPVAAPVAAPAAAPVAQPVVQPTTATAAAQRYPEGLEINSATGLPTCFGGFNPEVRPCHICPARGECQIKFMDL